MMDQYADIKEIARQLCEQAQFHGIGLVEMEVFARASKWRVKCEVLSEPPAIIPAE